MNSIELQLFLCIQVFSLGKQKDIITPLHAHGDLIVLMM